MILLYNALEDSLQEVRLICSDQESNFVGADNELKKALKELDEEKKFSRTEERKKRKSLKLRSKEKIGNIDVNVLQRELCKF